MATILANPQRLEQPKSPLEALPPSHLSRPMGDAGKAFNEVAKKAFWHKLKYLDRDFAAFWTLIKETSDEQSAPLAVGEVFDPLLDSIKRSERILSFQDDWDDEGSLGYKVATWERAKNFLLENAQETWSRYRIKMAAPEVLPGPDGSIDIHWRGRKRELLINIPEDLEQPIEYYGEDKAGQVVKGFLDISINNEWLFVWLMQ